MFHFVFHCAANNTYKDKYVVHRIRPMWSSKASVKTETSGDLEHLGPSF